MKILYWNCRGMGNSKTQRTLFSFCQQYSPDFVCIVEPMIDFSAIPFSFWNRLNLTLLACNDRNLPSIWLMGKCDGPSMSSIYVHEQHITVDFSLPHLQRLSFVYGSIWQNRRMHL